MQGDPICEKDGFGKSGIIMFSARSRQFCTGTLHYNLIYCQRKLLVPNTFCYKHFQKTFGIWNAGLSPEKKQEFLFIVVAFNSGTNKIVQLQSSVQQCRLRGQNNKPK